MESESYQPTPESGNLSSLKSELRQIFNPSFSTLGHGTISKKIDEILEQGLKSKFDDLGTTTIPLFDNSLSYDVQVDRVTDIILNWPHLNLKRVVIIMVPNFPEGQVGYGYFNSVFEELPDSEKQEMGVQYQIPTNYIKGYIDVDVKKFIPNPNFDPKPLTVKFPTPYESKNRLNSSFDPNIPLSETIQPAPKPAPAETAKEPW